MLFGLGRGLKKSSGAKLAGTLQGEDYFLDALPEPFKAQAWSVLGERAREMDTVIVPSRYYQEEMSRRLNIPSERLHVVHNGINLNGYASRATRPDGPPTLGIFLRILS